MVTLDPKVGADETGGMREILCQFGRLPTERFALGAPLIRKVDSLTRARPILKGQSNCMGAAGNWKRFSA
ncbi:hypothetical protein PanNE5_10090 [Pandoraea sp. NE5]|nr:MAG: hypothetical protein BGP02_20425 [Pandoraea sp. 64-18]BDD91569.1 hypothetical protein PanNE5_10090 [Pandoraea sp. NE5]